MELISENFDRLVKSEIRNEFEDEFNKIIAEMAAKYIVDWHIELIKLMSILKQLELKK